MQIKYWKILISMMYFDYGMVFLVSRYAKCIYYYDIFSNIIKTYNLYNIIAISITRIKCKNMSFKFLKVFMKVLLDNEFVAIS